MANPNQPGQQPGQQQQPQKQQSQENPKDRNQPGQQQPGQASRQFAPVVQQAFDGVLQAFDVFRLERFGLGFVYFLRDFQNIAQGFGQLFDQAKDFGAVFFVRAGSFDGLFNIAYDAHCYNSFEIPGCARRAVDYLQST